MQTGASPAAKPGTAPAWQDVFGQTMVKLCQKDNFVVGITAAMPSGTGMKILEKIERRNYDVLSARPHISKLERVSLLLSAVTHAAFAPAA